MLNAESYAKPHPSIPPFEPWPAPKGGYKMRHYSLDVKGEQGRFGDFLLHELHDQLSGAEDGPRDTSKLSPHFHDDFEQCSLALDGDFITTSAGPGLRTPAAWRDDDHQRCAAPSAAVIRRRRAHDDARDRAEVHQLVDIFSTPHVDFSTNRVGAERGRLSDAGFVRKG